MTLKERFLRWRASRGYGVHSPLAFRMVKHVVRPSKDVIYYGEERLLLESGDADPRDIRQARMLLRFVAELQPAYVWTYGTLPGIFIEAIRMAGGVVRIYDGDIYPDEISKADMTVAYRKELRKPQLRKALAPGKAMIAFGMKEKWVKGVAGELKSGIVLDMADAVIAVATAADALHCYNV